MRDVMGVEWGMITLMAGGTKPQRHTGRFHYIFFVVWGRAHPTLGDQYTVPYEEVPMAQGFVAEVQQENCYSIRNADALAPVTFLFCKTPGPMPAAEARREDVRRHVVG